MDGMNKAFWVIFVAILGIAFFVLVIDGNAFAYEEKISGNGGSIEDSDRITVVGTLTEEERIAVNEVRRLRSEENLKQVQNEIQRDHSLSLETLKFNNALMLERAGASKVNVSVSNGIRLDNSFNSENTATSN